MIGLGGDAAGAVDGVKPVTASNTVIDFGTASAMPLSAAGSGGGDPVYGTSQSSVPLNEESMG